MAVVGIDNGSEATAMAATATAVTITIAMAMFVQFLSNPDLIFLFFRKRVRLARAGRQQQCWQQQGNSNVGSGRAATVFG